MVEMWKLIFVLLIVVKTNADDDNRSASIVTKNKMKMVGQSFHKIQVNDLFECAQRLLSYNCQSFNYHKITSHCYVNTNTASNKDLIYDEEYIYGEKLSEQEEPSSVPPQKSCSELKKKVKSTSSGYYYIDPDGQSGQAPFLVYCNMTDRGGVGVTVVSHDSEARTLVDGYAAPGSYIKNVNYGVRISQLANLTEISAGCEQFVKFECYNDVPVLGFGWWVSRDGKRQDYWGGATPGSRKCACGITDTCYKKGSNCNCDGSGSGWKNDSGFLTEKSSLPVIQLRFGDTDSSHEQAFHTLGKLRCYGTI